MTATDTLLTTPQEGITRCSCGAKYWDGDRCHSCGDPFSPRTCFLMDGDPVLVTELDSRMMPRTRRATVLRDSGGCTVDLTDGTSHRREAVEPLVIQ